MDSSFLRLSTIESEFKLGATTSNAAISETETETGVGAGAGIGTGTEGATGILAVKDAITGVGGAVARDEEKVVSFGGELAGSGL